MRQPASLSLLVLACAAAHSADQGVVMEVEDLRLAVGTGPLPTEQDNRYVGVTDVYGQSYGVTATVSGVYGRLAPAGFLIGGELRYFNGSMTLDRVEPYGGGSYSRADLEAIYGSRLPDSSYTEAGAAVNLGGGYAVSASTHLELMGICGLTYVTLDRAAIDVSSGDLTTSEGDGIGYTLGVRAGVFWTDPGTRWQFGLTGEYTYNNAEIEVNYVDSRVTGDVIYDAYNVRASIGKRF